MLTQKRRSITILCGILRQKIEFSGVLDRHIQIKKIRFSFSSLRSFLNLSLTLKVLLYAPLSRSAIISFVFLRFYLSVIFSLPELENNFASVKNFVNPNYLKRSHTRVQAQVLIFNWGAKRE